jgi:hypothetical protein
MGQRGRRTVRSHPQVTALTAAGHVQHGSFERHGRQGSGHPPAVLDGWTGRTRVPGAPLVPIPSPRDARLPSRSYCDMGHSVPGFGLRAVACTHRRVSAARAEFLQLNMHLCKITRPSMGVFRPRHQDHRVQTCVNKNIRSVLCGQRTDPFPAQKGGAEGTRTPDPHTASVGRVCGRRRFRRPAHLKHQPVGEMRARRRYATCRLPPRFLGRSVRRARGPALVLAYVQQPGKH